MEYQSKKQCRICLENSEAMLNMFEDAGTTFKLELCCGVEILDISSLPSTICKKCFDILNVAYDFRVLCQRSQEYLSDTLAVEHDEQKPNLNEIDLPSYAEVEDNIVFDPQNNSNDEDFIEANAEINQNENKEEEDEAIHEPDDDKSSILSHITDKCKPDEVNFKSRKPGHPKPQTILMCNICGNIYKNKATFNYHMKLHQKDKKYVCEICSKRFMQTCELQAHMRVHTGEKPFNCSYCERKFSDRSGVTRHERTHTNERPYGCTICGAHFSYSATLKKHGRVHTGEKPFKCMICSKQFSESHQLKAHLGTIRHKEMAREKSKVMLII